MWRQPNFEMAHARVALLALASGWLLICALAHLAIAGPVQELAAEAEEEGALGAPMARRPIFFSELKLRAVVQDTNLELRDLKRDFMRQMSDLYLALKLHPTLGFERAREPLETDGNKAASANMLLAAELASMAMKKHLVQRRLLTGLKLAFVKMLPMQTLVQLFRRYKSYEWLKDQQQVDVRPKFPGAREQQFVILYTLIEARARLRAADDVLALTSNEARRVLQVAQWYLVDSKHGQELRGEDLETLALSAKQVIEFYRVEVLEWRELLHSKYEKFLRAARPLAAMLEGGQRQLLEFVDRLINVEALDIDLNGEARALALPPTISEQMIAGLQKRWLPGYVLKSLEEDRKLLMAHHKRVMHLVRLDPVYQEADLDEWSAHLLEYICRNSVTYYGR